MKTHISSQPDIKHNWHVVDASDKVLGRLATEVAALLRGKHKPDFDYGLDHGDFVVVINSEKISVTGKKMTDKIYYRHSGYTGNLKQEQLKDKLERSPDKVIYQAIKGMLPHNSLGAKLLKRVRIVVGQEHPYPVT